MRSHAFARHKKTLKALKKELESELRRLGEIEVQAEVDPVDQMVARVAREAHADVLRRFSEHHDAVVQSLARISDRTYGDCVECGEEIPLSRLDAVPWTPLCLACQEMAERDLAARTHLEALTAAA